MIQFDSPNGTKMPAVPMAQQIPASFKQARDVCTSPAPPDTSRSFTPMHSRHHHESYYFGYGDHGFPGPYADRHPFGQHPTIPMYQATHLDPATMPPTQYAAVWDVRDSLRQTPTTSPMIPSPDSTSSMIPPADPRSSPRASENGYPLISAPPVGMGLAQLQVSPVAVSGRVR